MRTSNWVRKAIDDKREWHAYRRRIKQLPAPYAEAATAVERYVLHTGPSDQQYWVDMLRDLAELFESAAAANTPVRDLVGDDPVDFAEEFKRNYGVQSWLEGEKARLQRIVTQAERRQQA